MPSVSVTHTHIWYRISFLDFRKTLSLSITHITINELFTRNIYFHSSRFLLSGIFFSLQYHFGSINVLATFAKKPTLHLSVLLTIFLVFSLQTFRKLGNFSNYFRRFANLSLVTLTLLHLEFEPYTKVNLIFEGKRVHIYELIFGQTWLHTNPQNHLPAHYITQPARWER